MPRLAAVCLAGLKILCDGAVNRLTGCLVEAQPPGWRGVNSTFERSIKMNKLLAALIAAAFAASTAVAADAPKKDEKKADKPAAAASAASGAAKGEKKK